MLVDKLLHITHAVENNQRRAELEKFYLDVFAAQTFYEARPAQGLERDETLTLIGKTQLIPQAPSDESAPVAKAIKAYAPGLKGMAVKVANLRKTDAHLVRHGLHLNYTDPMFQDVFFLTRPEETFNFPVEFCQVEMPNDLRLRPQWSADWWRDVHPLGIQKLSSIEIATKDLDAARKFYREVFEFEPIHQGVLESENARVAAFFAGDFIFEVLAPMAEGTPVADLVARRGGGIYALSFKVRSTSAAADYLRSKNLRLLGDTSRRFTIDPRDSFGARFTFLAEELPNDPRS
ncbi:MAG TPA: VOC family protein [Candidatus Binataceae bacterium]|nr:VOC family protein [Candidatus Binataceae bacterium]